jgi:hypothetical protein
MFSLSVDLTHQRAAQLDELHERFGQVVDGVARHVLTQGDELEVLERAVQLVAVLEGDDVVWGDIAVRGHPHQAVRTNPGPGALGGHRDLPIEVTVRVDALGLELVAAVVRHLALLELRLLHAPRGPSRTAQALVRGHVAFGKLVADSARRHAALDPRGRVTLEERGRLPDPELGGLGVHVRGRSAHREREFRRRLVRVCLPEPLHRLE